MAIVRHIQDGECTEIEPEPTRLPNHGSCNGTIWVSVDCSPWFRPLPVSTEWRRTVPAIEHQRNTMTQPPPFFENPDDTREEIMKATYVALCEHGYSDLTIQRIGDEFSKSKSLLYHHYDSKDELLLDFLEFMLERLEDQLPLQQAGGADDHIEIIVDRTFAPGDTTSDDSFSRALVELRSQAAHDERYREYFNRSDQFVRKHVAYVIRSGIEQGVLQDVDPRETAALFQIVFVGAMTQRVTSDNDILEDGRAAFERYVRECLLSEE